MRTAPPPSMSVLERGSSSVQAEAERLQQMGIASFALDLAVKQGQKVVRPPRGWQQAAAKEQQRTQSGIPAPQSPFEKNESDQGSRLHRGA